MNTKEKLRVVLLLVLAGVVSLEGLLWLRTITSDLLLRHYPYAGLTPEGRLRYWKTTYHREKDEIYFEEREYDAERNLLRTRKVPYHGLDRPGEWLRARPRLDRDSTIWHRMEDNPAFLRAQSRRFYPVDLAGRLNAEEKARRGSKDPPVVWERRKDGRLICRDRDTKAVLAGVGAEGLVRGPAAESVPPLEDRFVAQIHDYPGEGFVAASERRLIAVLPGGKIDRDLREPIEVHVSPAPEDAELVAMGRDRLLYGTGDALLLLDSLGKELARAPAGDELAVSGTFVLRNGQRVDGTTSTLRPLRPTGATMRLRLFRPDGSVVVEDVDFRPTSFGEHFLAALSGIAALLRPLPLNLASFVSSVPETRAEMNCWWWRDPHFAGASAWFWLLLSFAVAALCAWWAHRQARTRCDATRFWTVAAALLGPLGMVWMILVVGRAHVEEVGGEERAVDREQAAWPEPDRVGTEVFA